MKKKPEMMQEAERGKMEREEEERKGREKQSN